MGRFVEYNPPIVVTQHFGVVLSLLWWRNETELFILVAFLVVVDVFVVVFSEKMCHRHSIAAGHAKTPTLRLDTRPREGMLS